MTNQVYPRRLILLGLASILASKPALAISKRNAVALVEDLVADITLMIRSEKTDTELTVLFERIVSKYADMNVIARSTLGPHARTASKPQLQKFRKAFQGYFARKYSKQFKGFSGNQIILTNSRDRGKFFEVSASIDVEGSANVDVTFRVSDRSGEPRFFDIILEGISLLSSERVEIGALLDKRQGDINRLIIDIEELG